jgi:hypothetical protein
LIVALFRNSAKLKYSDRARGLATLFRSDSVALRILIFLAMSAIFFLFLKVTEKKVPTGLVPDSTAQQTTGDTGSATPVK